VRRRQDAEELPAELARFDPGRWAPGARDVAYGCTFAEAVADCTPQQAAMWRELFAWHRYCEARRAWDLEHGTDRGEATLHWLIEKARGDRQISDRHRAMWPVDS
jgi:hypothetical protein